MPALKASSAALSAGKQLQLDVALSFGFAGGTEFELIDNGSSLGAIALPAEEAVAARTARMRRHGVAMALCWASRLRMEGAIYREDNTVSCLLPNPLSKGEKCVPVSVTLLLTGKRLASKRRSVDVESWIMSHGRRT
jgi:hypothetical protein